MEVVVELALVHQLWVFSVCGLELDGDLEVGLGVDPLEDLSKSTFVQFPYYLVVPSYFLRNLRHGSSLINN